MAWSSGSGSQTHRTYRKAETRKWKDSRGVEEPEASGEREKGMEQGSASGGAGRRPAATGSRRGHFLRSLSPSNRKRGSKAKRGRRSQERESSRGEETREGKRDQRRKARGRRKGGSGFSNKRRGEIFEPREGRVERFRGRIRARVENEERGSEAELAKGRSILERIGFSVGDSGSEGFSFGRSVQSQRRGRLQRTKAKEPETRDKRQRPKDQKFPEVFC